MTGREEGPGYTDGGSARRRLARVVVVGMGSEWRRDDGVGMRVATLVAGNADGDAFANCQVVTQLGDPVDLLSHWDGADLAVVVDATRSGLAPGTVSLIELDQEGSELGIETRGEQGAGARTSWVAVAHRSPSSSHGLGLANVLRLARAVDRAPAKVVICGIEGEDFGSGSELSTAVAAAVGKAAVVVLELVEQALACA